MTHSVDAYIIKPDSKRILRIAQLISEALSCVLLATSVFSKLKLIFFPFILQLQDNIGALIWSSINCKSKHGKERIFHNFFFIFLNALLKMNKIMSRALLDFPNFFLINGILVGCSWIIIFLKWWTPLDCRYH